MKKVLFIDRDGTVIVEPEDEQIDSLDKLEFSPGVFSWLGKIAREMRFELVMVTNQDGLGTSGFPEEAFWPAHNMMIKALASEGIVFQNVFIDRSFPHESKDTRKPGIAMLTQYTTGEYDLANSYVIGDRITDVIMAQRLGAKAILYNDGSLAEELKEKGLMEICCLIARNWHDIYRQLSAPSRSAVVTRKTNETEIRVEINLDGEGRSRIATGLGFLDHMLDQLAKHGQIDLSIDAKGDLHIDEHHTIEDTALTLGEAFAKSLGDKRGIERYGFCLPMDDCLAQVAVDFGGRPWLVWNADFKREKIGEMPTEMFFHFFKSFSDSARCNLNIRAEGVNEHHKIEAIFKSFGRAVKMAIKREGTALPSTKGVL